MKKIETPKNCFSCYINIYLCCKQYSIRYVSYISKLLLKLLTYVVQWNSEPSFIHVFVKFLILNAACNQYLALVEE